MFVVYLLTYLSMNHLKGAEIDIFSVMEIHLVLSKTTKQVQQSHYNRVDVMSYTCTSCD